MWQRLRAAFRQLANVLALWRRDDQAAEACARRRAPEITNMLQNEAWADLRLQFHPVIRWVLSESMLKKGHAMLQLSTGPIVHTGEPVFKTSWRGWITAMNIPVEFQRMKLGMSLTMTSSGSLVGLRFYPLHILGFGSPWSCPIYASTTSFQEEKVELGTSALRVGGTLALPRSAEQCPCVVMLAGSGPCDRDASVGSAKPFKDIAWGLASRGIASLRFDKVTFAHGTKIRAKKSFTITDEYVEHALDAIHHCTHHAGISSDSIFILGHSLGAYVAPELVRSQPRVAGCILMAAPTIPFYWSAIRQLQRFASLDGISQTQERPEIVDLRRQCELADDSSLDLSTSPKKLPFGIGPAYWLDMRNYRPIETCRFLERPVMVMAGGRDYQTTLDFDFYKWSSSLSHLPNVRMETYESLNHLFIAGVGESTPREYDDPGNVDAAVVRDLHTWIMENSPSCAR